MREIIGVGLISGITVSLIKLVQWNFHLDDLTLTQALAALLTTAAYMLLGAIGAVFLVDHEATGQKMLKNAFLVGFMAPSFFLALLNNPATIRPDFQRTIESLPKISGLLISSALAQGSERQTPAIDAEWEANENRKFAFVLHKKDVEPSLGVAIKNAFGWNVAPRTYTYVVGTTDDPKKAAATASSINRILHEVKGPQASAFVVKPEGLSDLYITVGTLGTAEHATMNADFAKQAGFNVLPTINTVEGKKAAALLLGGRVVDARAMFHAPRD